MKIRVLGSAAGGGYPQWNCNHPNSARARDPADSGALPRTQSSIAVSQDGEGWFLFNASPDLRKQINDNDILHPKNGLRHSPIQGAVLTNADVDHIAGLLNLRESQAFNLYGTAKVLEVLKANSVFNILNPDFVDRVTLKLGEPTELSGPDSGPSGIVVVPFAVPGKVALWLEDKSKPVDTKAIGEDTVALEVRDRAGETKFFYVPGCAEVPEWLSERLRGAPVVLFDGTLWRDDEMIVSKVGVNKTGHRMGHISLSGEDGSIAAFRDLGVKRKIFIHINTTNPVLLEDSPERAAANEAGWEVSYDGMEVAV
jgi:pyrroloquinoline quinone biosynthesis protein B